MRIIIGTFIAVIAVGTVATSADQGKQRMTVKVLEVQNSETEYSGVLPGRVNTYVAGPNVTSTVTPAQSIAYSVRGATLQLLLPDGRIAVVNCVSKYQPRFDYVNRRSCRVPDQAEIDVEFKGQDAKLYWMKLAGLDERKAESETYRLIAVQK